MAQKRKQAAKAGAAAYGATSPYVQRLLQDEELRANLYQAFDSARSAYGRVSNGRSKTKTVFDDKRFQKDVKKAAGAGRDAAVGLREGPKRQGGLGLGRLILLLLVGGGAALAASEGLRKKVLDLLFGAEEEFEYTSTTTTVPATPASPAAPVTPVTPVTPPSEPTSPTT